MDDQQFPHSIKSNQFDFTRDVQDKFKILFRSFNEDIKVSNHYTFSKKEILAMMGFTSDDGKFEVNALTIKPVVENGELIIYIVGTKWNEDENKSPDYPGGGFPDGPPILRTKNGE